MIKRIKIEGYKSLAEVEVNLKPLSLLFGPNAAGKSNFLDALQLLSRTASSRTLKEAFAPPTGGHRLNRLPLDQTVSRVCSPKRALLSPWKWTFCCRSLLSKR